LITANSPEDRAHLVTEITKVLSYKSQRNNLIVVHDQGGFSNQEMKTGLDALYDSLVGKENYVVKIPHDVEHFVMGHGHGYDNQWRFMHGGQESVPEYVNQQVPKGKKAWCIVCDDRRSRAVELAEGKTVISQGV
jgi:hypothetical protein